MELLKSQARIEGELSEISAVRSFGFRTNRSLGDSRSEMGRWGNGTWNISFWTCLGNWPNPNDYECELVESDYLSYISFEKLWVVVGGWAEILMSALLLCVWWILIFWDLSLTKVWPCPSFSQTLTRSGVWAGAELDNWQWKV